MKNGESICEMIEGRYRAAEVLEALRGITYGSLEIIVHGAEVVQIIRTEKVRFDRPVDS